MKLFNKKPYFDEEALHTEVLAVLANTPPDPEITPLQSFRFKTINVIERLNEEINRLRSDIDSKGIRLAELERIRSAEELALNHMED